MSENTTKICLLCPLCKTPLEVEREFFVPQDIIRGADGKIVTKNKYTDISTKHGSFYLWCPGCNWDYAGMEPEDFTSEYLDSVVIIEERA